MSSYRIFISYRRNDSVQISGRIYDQISQHYGQKSVFKDVQDIHAGEDFRRAIEKALEQAEVMLVVIGPQWLTIADSTGQRRLESHEDFVRIEIETALKRPDLLIIPVLVGGARMPAAEELPSTIRELSYRNALPLRDDPDFKRDIEALNAQIDAQIRMNRWRRPALLGVVVAFVIVMLFLLLHPLIATTPDYTATQLAALPTDVPMGLPMVAPVAADEFMVLVASPQSIGAATIRDTGDTIAANLTRELAAFSYSKTQVRRYPAVITSDARAAEVAAQDHAWVIVWGQYTDQDVILNVQLGAVQNRLPANDSISLNSITALSNVVIDLKDEQIDSIAAPVLVDQFLGQTLAGNMFEPTRTLVMLAQLAPSTINFVTDSAASETHQAMYAAIRNPQSSLKAINAALSRSGDNGFLYLLRAYIYMLQDDFASARLDIDSARSFAASEGNIPDITEAFVNFVDVQSPAAETIEVLNRLIAANPHDWFAHYLRGVMAYLNGDLPTARREIAQSIGDQPEASFPYVFEAILDLQQGYIKDTLTQVQTIDRRFPDKAFGEVYLQSLFGSRYQGTLKPLFSIFGQLLLNRYAETIASTTDVLNSDQKASLGPNLLANAYLIRGYAYCNLNDDKDAAADYTQGLSTDPTNVSLYMLRADSRRRLGNLAGALADLSSALAAADPQARAELSQYLQANQHGAFTCKTSFTYTLPPLVYF